MDENSPYTPPQTPLPPAGTDPAPKNKDENTLGIVCHLLSLAGCVVPVVGQILGPLVLWLIKKPDSPYLDAVGKEVVNFNISFTIYGAIGFILCLVFIGVLLLPLLGIAWLVLTIIGAIKASEGKIYRYPLTIRLIK
ncbi:MAG: DUF4870 domain-containing protein [Verrucomicrobiaceae bacterium]|nr:DUF4870 domain-containing protein [Verrucomicrobiaceae bacterium]